MQARTLSTPSLSPAIRAILLVVAMLGPGCGLFGGTRAKTVAITPVADAPAVAIGSLTLEPGQTKLANVGTFAIGEYKSKDLDALQQSLQQSLRQSRGEPIGGQAHRVHVVIRRFLVSHSNTAGVALACVAWAMTDANGELVYHEQFYAADSVHLWGTIGRLKEHVHQGIVARVLGSARSIASGGDPVTAQYTFADFDAAAAGLPHQLRSVYLSTALLGGGYGFRVSTVDGSADLGWARQQEHVDWTARVGSPSR